MLQNQLHKFGRGESRFSKSLIKLPSLSKAVKSLSMSNDKIIPIYGNEFRIVEHETEPVPGAIGFDTEQEAEEYLINTYPGKGKVN